MWNSKLKFFLGYFAFNEFCGWFSGTTLRSVTTKEHLITPFDHWKNGTPTKNKPSVEPNIQELDKQKTSRCLSDCSHFSYGGF